jgi:hypothetical protein
MNIFLAAAAGIRYKSYTQNISFIPYHDTENYQSQNYQKERFSR